MDAVGAALAVAARMGMGDVDPHMLRSTNNTVIWLHPFPVVAKVAPEADSHLEWESVVASALGRLRAPAVAPLETAGTAVHHHEQWVVSLWPCHRQTAVSPDPAALALALARLHDALDEAARHEGWSLPDWSRGPHEVMTRLGDTGFAPALRADDRALLARVLGRSHEVAALSARRRTLHGSPHGFNVLVVDGEPAFIDFETACSGPVEWDLSHLDPTVAAAYRPGFNVEALELSRLVVSAMTSALCWEGVDRGEDMRAHAEHHLSVVRGGC